MSRMEDPTSSSDVPNSERGDGSTRLQRFQRHVGQRVGRGVLALIPLLVTALIVWYMVALGEGLFAPLVNLILDVSMIQRIPGATPLVWIVVLLATLAFLYLLGALVTGSGGRNRVRDMQNAVLRRIPVVNSIYGVARQATEALSAGSRHEFRSVVFLEWPRPGVRAMGFVTGRCILPEDNRPMLVVYIATVPNPTSGMLAIVGEDEVTETDMSVEDAMKIIFSGGIVMPDAMLVEEPLTLPRVGRESSDTPPDGAPKERAPVEDVPAEPEHRAG